MAAMLWCKRRVTRPDLWLMMRCWQCTSCLVADDVAKPCRGTSEQLLCWWQSFQGICAFCERSKPAQLHWQALPCSRGTCWFP